MLEENASSSTATPRDPPRDHRSYAHTAHSVPLLLNVTASGHNPFGRWDATGMPSPKQMKPAAATYACLACAPCLESVSLMLPCLYAAYGKQAGMRANGVG